MTRIFMAPDIFELLRVGAWRGDVKRVVGDRALPHSIK